MALAGVYNKGESSHSQGTLLRLGKRNSDDQPSISDEQDQSVSAHLSHEIKMAYDNVVPSRPARDAPRLSVGLILRTLRVMVEEGRRAHAYELLKRNTKMRLNTIGK